MDIAKNHKNIFILIAINIILFIQAFSRFGMFFIDTSREVYVPMIMNQGDILYKDIFNVYSPLGYQLNAFFLSVFGDSLNTYYVIGLINSLIFIIGFYLTANLFLKKHLALISSIFISITCIYAVSLVNYIFPYSYSVVFSLTTFTFSLYFLLKYIEKSKKSFLLFSFFLFGLCTAFKYEFILFSAVLFPILFISKITIKDKIFSIILLLLIPVLSLTTLFIQGCTFDILLNSLKEIILLAKSQNVKFCYEFLGLIPTTNSIKELIIYFFKSSFVLLFLFFTFYNLKKIKNIIFRRFLIFSFSLLIILLLKNVFYESNSFYFNWIGVFTILSFLALSYILFRKKIVKKIDKLFFIFLLSIILSSVKGIFSVNFNNYGTYYFPLLFLGSISFIYIYFPYIFKIKKKKTIKSYRKCFALVTIILILLYTISNIERRNYSFNHPITTKKGTIFVDEYKSKAIINTINYINLNTKSNDKIIVLPEGAMINYLTNRKSHNKFYYLIPPNIEIFEEDNIVKELKENLPEYLVIQPMSYTNFNQTYFCESFGQKICGLIPQYYESPIVFGDNFWLAIYKKKETNEK